MDFSTGSGVSQSFIDVLRNHLYAFSVNKVSGIGAAKIPVKVSVKANMTNVQRTGYIVVKAGTMEVKIKVTQGDTPAIRVKIVDHATDVELTK